MNRRFVLTAVTSLALGAAALGQAAEQPQPAVSPTQAASELAERLIRRVGESLGVKAVVGQSITAGSITLIPILMIEVDFGGAGLVSPGGPPSAAPKAAVPQAPQTPQAPQAPQAPLIPPTGADGFLMSGEARPLGFIVVTRQGTRFISVTQTSGK